MFNFKIGDLIYHEKSLTLVLITEVKQSIYSDFSFIYFKFITNFYGFIAMSFKNGKYYATEDHLLDFISSNKLKYFPRS